VTGPGIVVICGTGSICYGRNAEGLAARSGGWGYILGDEGSGYWLGRQALAAVVRHVDGRGPATSLTAVVLEHFRVRQVNDLIQEVHLRDPRRHRVASLGGALQAAIDAGDPVAREILDEGARDLAGMAESVAQRLQMRGAVFPVRTRRRRAAGGARAARPPRAAPRGRRPAEPRATAHRRAGARCGEARPCRGARRRPASRICEMSLNLEIHPNEERLAADLAARIAGALQRTPRLVLGLPTGRTPVALYRELVRLARERRVDFSQATTFNLDEFLGIPPTHPAAIASSWRRTCSGT
jgi:hypothetical protein